MLILNKERIHQRCKNVLLTKVYKYLDCFSTELMNEVFYLHQNLYNLNILTAFATDNLHKNFYLKSKMENTIFQS